MLLFLGENSRITRNSFGFRQPVNTRIRSNIWTNHVFRCKSLEVGVAWYLSFCQGNTFKIVPFECKYFFVEMVVGFQNSVF